MPKRISVVVSQGQSNNPARRKLEEDIVAGLLMVGGIDVTVVPHLYDLEPDGTGVLALQSIDGDLIVLSWLYERAARWILGRHGIHGQQGRTLLADDDDDQEHEDGADQRETTEDNGQKQRVIELRQLPNRRIYCIDLRQRNAPRPFIDEVKRIVEELNTDVVSLELGQPDSQTTDASSGNGKRPAAASAGEAPAAAQPRRIDEQPLRRWYPVIDYSRCTNCMECIDFCLFGVYGVDEQETILVEQPDNCRKGCPACSRVCPENAIIFPQHKTPAIAGAAEAAAGLKIDLSQLFGAPQEGKSAVEVAVAERDEQLLLAGRQPVGHSVGIPKRQQGKPPAPKDELDELIDQLDELDL